MFVLGGIGHELGHLDVAAVVTAIGVGLNLDIGLNELHTMRQGKADVLDGQATLQPLHLIVGLDVQDVIGQAAGIQVIGIGLDGQVILLDEGVSISIEEGAIGLQVDDAAVAQDIAVIV